MKKKKEKGMENKPTQKKTFFFFFSPRQNQILKVWLLCLQKFLS